MFIVIGSSGFLGKEISTLLKGHAPVLTHYTNQVFKNSIKYDVFLDHPYFLPDKPCTVIFTSAVETSASTKEVKSAMTRLLSYLAPHRFIYLSSDGIFSGHKGYYSENDVPEPKTLYGRNLMLCETLIRQTLTNYCIIRPSYIYGKVEGQLDNRLGRIKEALQAGEVVSGFYDMYKSPLGVRQLAQAVVSTARSEFIGTIHIAGERMSAYDFYQQAMTALGVSTDNLKAEAMPDSPQFLKDTSLDTSTWFRLFGVKPLSITETFTL